MSILIHLLQTLFNSLLCYTAFRSLYISLVIGVFKVREYIRICQPEDIVTNFHLQNTAGRSKHRSTLLIYSDKKLWAQALRYA